MCTKFWFLLFFLLPLGVFSQDTFVIKSKFLPKEDTSIVYKPKSYYQNNDSLGCAILLHGYQGNYLHWTKITDLQSLADRYNLILICPDGYESWYINSTKDTSWQYESFFEKEFLPYIFRRYRIKKDALFITGLSMGGFGAINLYLKNKEKFACFGAMSAVVNLKNSSVYKSIEKLIGPKNSPSWDSLSIVNRIEELKMCSTTPIIDCGKQDFLFAANKDFFLKCQSMDYRIIFSYSDGTHNRDYWKRMLPNHLMYFRQFVKN